MAPFRAHLHAKHALLAVISEWGTGMRPPDFPSNLDGVEWRFYGVTRGLARHLRDYYKYARSLQGKM